MNSSNPLLSLNRHYESLAFGPCPRYPQIAATPSPFHTLSVLGASRAETSHVPKQALVTVLVIVAGNPTLQVPALRTVDYNLQGGRQRIFTEQHASTHDACMRFSCERLNCALPQCRSASYSSSSSNNSEGERASSTKTMFSRLSPDKSLSSIASSPHPGKISKDYRLQRCNNYNLQHRSRTGLRRSEGTIPTDTKEDSAAPCEGNKRRQNMNCAT